jgi:hypothetical protein
LVTVVEKYRGVRIIRDSPSALNTASVNAEVTSLRAVFRTIAKGAQSVEAVQAEIDKMLDTPPDPPIP